MESRRSFLNPAESRADQHVDMMNSFQERWEGDTVVEGFMQVTMNERSERRVVGCLGLGK